MYLIIFHIQKYKQENKSEKINFDIVKIKRQKFQNNKVHLASLKQ